MTDRVRTEIVVSKFVKSTYVARGSSLLSSAVIVELLWRSQVRLPVESEKIRWRWMDAEAGQVGEP